MDKFATSRRRLIAAEDDGSLPSMLARAYDPTPDGEGRPSMLFNYGNIARQLVVRGLRSLDPAMEDEDRLSEWLDARDGLYLDDLLVQLVRTEVWTSVGFGPADVTQTMVIGDPPTNTCIYRGSFDEERTLAALAALNYERVETGRGPVMTIGREGEIDAAVSILGGSFLNSYNNIAVVDDAHVVASPYLANVEATLATLAGDGRPLAYNPAVATLMAAVGEELVSATVMDGGVLSVANMPYLSTLGVPTPEPSGTISKAAHALFGITPGSMPPRSADEADPLRGDNDETAPRSAFVVALHLGSEEEAEAAAPVITARLADGESLVVRRTYQELFGPAVVEAVAGTPIVRVRLTGDQAGRFWLQAIQSRDLTFLFTE